jgi:spermidine synthase
MVASLYVFFFCSGLSGLIYEVVWVRVFGNVFGNTIYSASLVVAVFMLGLGAGSYGVGVWADRQYVTRPETLLRAYGYFELLIGGTGLAISALLPHLGHISAQVSTYSREASGWYVLSAASSLSRAAIAVALLTPITLLMGGTLTLLIRHLVRNDFAIGGWRVAVLYAVNTGGAALGVFLTDFALVPVAGLRTAQIVAVIFNLVAGAGALIVARIVRLKPAVTRSVRRTPRAAHAPGATNPADATLATPLTRFTSAALAMSGFAAMGMEILWFRHFTILLGAFRAVFSLLLTVILIGIGAGSLLSGFLHRRTAHPAQWLMVMQALFVAAALLGLATADARNIEAIVTADPAYLAGAGSGAEGAPSVPLGLARVLRELWFNTRPMLVEVGVPALLMGFSFPLANAVIQRAERFVGRSAGVLYLANTLGAVCGSLAAGFLLLPKLGIQGSATLLLAVAALAVVPLHFAQEGRAAEKGVGRPSDVRRTEGLPTPFSRRTSVLAGSVLVSGAAIALWLRLPPGEVNTRALRPAANERVIALSEGLTELVAVTELEGGGRRLLTNGHPMSATTRLSQRYMRALAHIPLLSIEQPQTVLVIGFGVGNTTHAATLHPSITRVEVADLSRDILAHARYFADVNRGVLRDPRVIVYVNDGRHHLQMQSPSSYDLITLEPPPIGYAGVAALYSEEFYRLARTRLKPKGCISQWLPAYQVPTATTLSMIRAFVDVFPQAVLISGAEADLLLIGVNDSRIEIDPERVATALSRAPAVEADLRRLDLGSVREIVGTFVGAKQTLVDATRDAAPVSDDRPIQEYGVQSLLNFGEAVPASVVDLSQVAAWCPKCFVDGRPVSRVEGLDTYLALLGRAYMASPADVRRARSLGDQQTRTIAGSAYLGAVVPESADVHNLLGVALATKQNVDEAIAEFRQALRLEPESAMTHWHLGAALASRGARREAIDHLDRSVLLDPKNSRAQYDFGIFLALDGRLDEAIEHLQLAATLDPGFADAARNLTILRRQRQLRAQER